MPDPSPAPLLAIRGLRVTFPTRSGALDVVDRVSLDLEAGRALGLVGESGSGKSMLAHALVRAVPHPGRLASGAMRLTTEAGTVDLATLDPAGDRMREVRARQIGIVFQDATASLTPVLTIGEQLVETIRLSRTPARSEATALALELLARVGMPDPRRMLVAYPHQLSGGLAQRAMIALALCGRPRLLVADEPTTALDPVRRAEIVDLIAGLQAELGMAVLHISHDLPLVAAVADRVAVMYAGRIVETGPPAAVLGRPAHPYTAALAAATPSLDRVADRFATLSGGVPHDAARWRGCAFAPRCADALAGRCEVATPALVTLAPGRTARCFLRSPEIESR